MERAEARLGEWTSATVRIALLGDSTLDNVLWVGDSPCIAEQLAATSENVAVANLAADGYTTCDTLHGNSRVISVGIRGRAGEGRGCDPLQYEVDGRFCPLVRLAKLRPPPTHVVLSVGGNDVREILSDMGRLPEVMSTFMSKYAPIVEACLQVTQKCVLMLQYRPSFYMDGGGYGVYQALAVAPGPGEAGNSVQKINKLMETIYAPVFAFARDKGLAIADLARTFDIYADELYSHQIEPSAKGGEVIVTILHHIIKQHGAQQPSTFYTYSPCTPGGGEVKEEMNDGRPWIIPYTPGEVPYNTNAMCGADSKVLALVGMGFERAKVEDALRRCGGDQGRAVAALLGD